MLFYVFSYSSILNGFSPGFFLTFNISGIDLIKNPWHSLPFGQAIAVCDLTDCIEMTKDFINEQLEAELLCGHWEPGRFAWKLDNINPLSNPIPIKGQQGLWDINLPFIS
ncbi:hypothetical protein [Cyanothece sp. BG0011]|uniref:hypothetical protein n=1 Tax=Cyanothece sp. BG0011 TaxID=2082950 RepID=UPI0018E56016|nr:hypothetical protein [Cyanothece sp. BG0011]